jgi:hypothetical protein
MQTLTFNGKKTTTGSITDRIKTLQDACNELGISSGEITIQGDIEKDFKSVVSYQKLIIIARALNEDWTPDWKNSSQYKYYPWFDMSSGSGLSFCAVDYRFSDTAVGSRLCFKNRQLVEYAVKQFIELYKDIFLIR